MKFQSRALFWGKSSLVSQNAAHMEPVTVPAASDCPSLRPNGESKPNVIETQALSPLYLQFDV